MWTGYLKALAARLSGAGLAVLLAAGAALALDGQPAPWQLGFQPAASPIMEQTNNFHNLLLVIITVITLFVLFLLLWVIIRFNEKANPVPSKTSHHTMLEVAWTILPVVILVVIAVPSFRLLYAQYEFPKPDLIIKAIGHQWYWSYEYPQHGSLKFDSIMIEDKDLKPGQPRLLSVDREIYVPVNKVVEVLVTADDVLHNWAVPAFGCKIDAVPGKITRTWFKATRTGVFYGQCSELCGTRHAFMPIAVRVVSDAEFDAWLKGAKTASAHSGERQNDHTAASPRNFAGAALRQPGLPNSGGGQPGQLANQ